MSEPLLRAQKVAELVRLLCIALSNVEMFGVLHPVAVRNLDEAFTWMTGLFAGDPEPITISVSDKRILMDGMPLEERNPMVARLAGRLEEVHANYMTIDPAITPAEFLSFFELLAKGARHINNNGGMAALLKQTDIVHISLREVSYVRIGEDEKVVSRDAKVVHTAIPIDDAGREIAAHVLDIVFKRAEDQQWMISEMKNSPQKMANLFVEGITLAASRAQMGMGDTGSGVQALIHNIQLVGQSLTAPSGEAPDGDREQLEKSVLMLENELRQRSATLMSSEVARGFLNEILGVITSYSDQVRARQVSDEFLKGENTLRKTEQLLRRLAPGDEPIQKFLDRVGNHLKQRGMTEDDLTRLAQAIESRPPATRKPRKPYSQAVSEGIARRLKDLNLDSATLDKAVQGLGAFIEDRVRERAGEWRETVDGLQRSVSRRDQALKEIPLGIVLWDAKGNVDFTNPATARVTRSETGPALSAALSQFLSGTAFPLPDAQPPIHAPLSDSEMHFAHAVRMVLKDNDGNVLGVILKPPDATGGPT